MLARRILYEHRFVAAQFIEHDQAICRERTTGFYEVDDRIGDAERDHHFDGACELDDVGRELVLVQIRLGDARKACGNAAAGEVARLANGAILRHAHRQSPIAHSQRQAANEIDAGFGNEVAAGDSHVDRAFGTQDGDVVGAEKRHLDRHIADAGKQAALLPAKLESGSDQQLGRHLG